MRKVVIGAAAGALVATAAFGSTAFAANHTVSVGGQTSAGTHKFFAKDKSGIDFVVRNSLGVDIAMSCGAVNVEGEVYSGTYDTDTNPIARIKAVTRVPTPDGFNHSQWKNCIGPLGVAMTVVPLNEWEIYAPGPTITGGNSDVIDGYIAGPGGGALGAHVYATSGGPTGTACNFTVNGAALGSFDEATQQLTVDEQIADGNLSVGTVTGNCFGLIQSGNSASFEGQFDVGPDVEGNEKDTAKEDWTPFPIYIS